MIPPGSAGPKRASLSYTVLALGPALLSLGLHRTLRAVLNWAKRRYSARNPASSRQWQILSREFVGKPLVVPLIMTAAPRWNPHAVIGTLGPLAVRETISFAARDARGSGEWFFAVYSHPDHQPAGSVSHLHDGGGDWVELKVPRAGHYVVGARYYRPTPAVAFPVVRVDGVEIATATAAPQDTNRFYADLWKRENALYRALAFYVVVLLRCRGRVPERWIARELIPVGNPETRFAYGTCRDGARLSWQLGPGAFEAFDTYLTIYSTGSFPRFWRELDVPAGALTAPCDGFYLARIQPKAAQPRETSFGDRFPAIEIASSVG